ncbi:MAG TPA: ATP-binding protein [Gemmatimonadaceae bacterium]
MRLDRLPLRWRVPALFALTLLAALAAFGIVAWGTVRQSELAAARLQQADAAGHVAGLLEAAVRNFRNELSQVASAPAVVAVAASGNLTDSARAVLARLAPVGGASVAFVDAQGRVHAVLGEVLSAEVAPEVATADSIVFGPLFLRDSVLAYCATAPVRVGNQVRGHIVNLRPLTRGLAVLQVVEELIGREETLLFGNADGSLWTDLSRQVALPSPDNWRDRYTRDGQERLAGLAKVEGTPWVIAVELPEFRAADAAQAVMLRFAALALLIGTIGALVGYHMSRGITGPLEQLTASAEAITAGDLQARDVVDHRQDEIGRLARAFAIMADSVRQSRDHLEKVIGHRTRELEMALQDLQQAQEELVRKERLATLGQLSSTIGHELRNPLAVMLNVVYILEATLASAPAKTREYLGVLREQIRISERIVTDLLDAVRTRPPQRVAVPVQQLVDEPITRCSIPSCVRVERAFDDTAPPVLADPDQVGQIMVNLVTNAVQALGESGGILRVSSQVRDGQICIAIRDTGPGIDPAHLEQIFEPLFTTKARGIGLGLWISRTLARANGGDLTASNHPEGGAVFSLSLPVVVT